VSARLRSVGFDGLRSLRGVELALDGLTVLIGENGSGKSTILEGLQLLRRIGTVSFQSRFNEDHGGVSPLMGGRGGQLTLAASAESSKYRFHYSATIHGDSDGRWWFDRETLDATKPGGSDAVHRERDVKGAIGPGGEPGMVGATVSALVGDFGGFTPCVDFREALAGIEVQVPFDARAGWSTRQVNIVSPMRTPQPLTGANEIRPFGSNIASAFQALKNGRKDHWERTLDYVRLGLGERVEDVAVEVLGQGFASIVLVLRSGVRVGASAMSDGMLSYLAYVAMFRLSSDGRSLLAFDEPEAHLHPGLLMRVLGMFEAEAKLHPVVLATHSDALLDALENPVKSVVVCELDPDDQTRLRRLDEHALTKWVDRFRGLGDARANGELPLALADEEPGSAAQ